VSDDQLMLAGKRGQRLDGQRYIGALGYRVRPLATLEQGVASEGRDDTDVRAPGKGTVPSVAQRRNEDGLDAVHAVLRLVEHDGCVRLEDLVGDLESVQSG
jgi:hypothetical protein